MAHKMTRPWTPRLYPRRLLAWPVRAYRFLLSPWLGSACRFEPTCSSYALLALDRHGALRGGWLATHRVLRCHPWCEGGLDPVPPVATDPNALTKNPS